MVARRSSVPRHSGSRPSSSGVGSSPSPNDAKVTVPKLNHDPVWSLRPWPLVVSVAGRDHEIPAMPAADWLAYLLQDQPDLDGLLEDLLPDIPDLLLDGVLEVEEAYELLLDILETVGARPWWVTLRLASFVAGSYDVLGPDLIKRRVDPERHSLSAWMDVALIAVLNAMEPKDTTMFLMKLEANPEGEPAELIDTMEMDRGAFMAMGMN